MKRALLVLAACGGGTAPSATPTTAIVKSAVDPAAHLTTVSEDVAFAAGADQVPATLVRPDQKGTVPGIVLFAGSGPTDRDWNTPLIQTTNGSGTLLAEALASHGAVVLRFDKAGVAGNKTSLDGKTIDVYVDEARGALAYLRTRPEVDPHRLYIAGHSEGGAHAIRTALVEGPALSGVLLLSAGGRTMRDIILGQLTAQIERAAPGQTEKVIGPFRAALDKFIAGEAIDPKAATPIPGLQQLLASLVHPATAMVGRGLLVFDPITAVSKLTVPIFIYNGERDVQVDPTLDAKALAAAAQKTNKDVTLFLAPEADHVLKHETETVDKLRENMAGLESHYNAPDRGLDEASVTAIVGWLAAH